MIPLMDSISRREPSVLWSFWLSCALAATGGVAALLLAAGGTNRIAGAAIPFGIAAAAMAVNALTYQRGRPVATALYFLAGIALVYGMLSIIAVPLRLAVLGTCPPAPATCPVGFERPMTSGEDAGLAIGVAMGTLAILVGFFGLLMLFRLRPQVATPPPVRREAAVVAPPPAVAADEPAKVEPAPAQVPEPEAGPAAVTPTGAEPEPAPRAPSPPPAPGPRPAPRPRAKRTPKPQAELAPPAEPAELPAPEEPLELPAPSSPSEDEPSKT